MTASTGDVAVTDNGDNMGIGAVWVFTRSGNVWTQQGSKLVGTGSVGSPFQGGSVALSSGREAYRTATARRGIAPSSISVVGMC
jgi:hypothetical protein